MAHSNWTNKKQFEQLVKCLEEKPEVAKGFQTGVGRVDTDAFWNEVTEKLNSLEKGEGYIGKELHGIEPDNDRFEFLRLVGEGSHGKVFSARVKLTQQKIAVKVVEQLIQRIDEVENELEILRNMLPHRNLPLFYGLFLKESSIESRREIYFAMELCDGGSATDLVSQLKAENRRLSNDQIAYILGETVSGVKFLHDHNYMHRDIKGDNIMLTADGHVKVIDFGITVKISDALEGKLTTVGTPHYMAPEVITCDQYTNETYDSRSDVWSIGITAIELAEGDPPMSEIHPNSVMFHVPRRPPPKLASPIMRTVYLNDFIKRCLIKNYKVRPYIGDILRHPYIKNLNDVSQIREDLKYEIVRQNVLKVRRNKKHRYYFF